MPHTPSVEAHMADDQGLVEALCRLTALTPEQLTGLDALAAMTPAEVEAFAIRVVAAWEANRLDLQGAKQRFAEARRAQAQVETRCGEAARRRFLRAGGIGMCVLDDIEQAAVSEARSAVAAAVADHEQACARFKGGVTAEQLGA